MSTLSSEIRRAKAGDRDAIARIFESCSGDVERAARAGLGPLLASRFDPGDICQSVFADMIREMPDFELRGEAAFRRWLVVKVRNKLTSKARRARSAGGGRREARLETAAGESLAAASEGPPEELARRDDVARVSALLGTLAPADRAVLGLAIDERMSWAQIAAALGVASPDAARMRYVRALAALRDAWEAT